MTFPVETPFIGIEDALAYLNQERITCLRCGKSYKSLQMHLQAKHGWTVAEYKEFYHLPRKKGLTSAAGTELRRDHALQQMAAGLVDFGGKLGAAGQCFEYEFSAFQRKQYRANILNAPQHVKRREDRAAIAKARAD